MSTLNDIAAGQAALDDIDGRRDDGIAQVYSDDGRPRPQSAVLIDIGRTHELFHDRGGDAYARVRNGTRMAVMAIGGSEYRESLGREFFALSGKGANRNAVSDAVSTLSAMARYDGAEEAVFLRVAGSATGIEIDLGDDTGEAVNITSGGWTISAPTVNFRRSGKPMPLPRPTKADFARLWRYVNVAESDRPLVAAWLLASLRPRGPFPIALLIGEQGTGKSLASRTLKRLVDPSAVLLRPPPREDRDLQVAAVSSWCVALDNLSGINAQLSDCLCRVATGGGFAARKLYSDADETLIDVQRPMLLNGIDDVASRPDLADRCLHLLLPPLVSRKAEADIEREFAVDGPAIFAALLDALVLAVRDHAAVRLDKLPRMADFATWAVAGLPALGFTAGDFLSAYAMNRDHLAELAVDASPVASALAAFMATRSTWTGSSAELLGVLADASPGAAGSQAWPRSAKGLMGALRRVAPALRSAGITVTARKTEARNVIDVCRVGKDVPDVPDVPATPFQHGASGACGLADVPDVPAKTRVAGTTGAYGALRPALHPAAAPPPDRQCTAAEYRALRGAE